MLCRAAGAIHQYPCPPTQFITTDLKVAAVLTHHQHNLVRLFPGLACTAEPGLALTLTHLQGQAMSVMTVEEVKGILIVVSNSLHRDYKNGKKKQ